MLRHTLAVVTAAFLAAVVGAQGPKEPTTGQRGELFRKNRSVIESLVKETVQSAHTPHEYVKRANSYYPVLHEFNTKIAEAAGARDTARVEELTRHLETLLDKGLAPTLVKAREQVENGTGVEEFREAKQFLLAQVNALLGLLSDSPATKALLEGTKQKLDAVRIPEK